MGWGQLIAMGAQGAAQGAPGASASKPYQYNGMDLNSLQRILDPAGVGGGGGMNKNAAEAFFDPAGIDSSSIGLDLFGKRPQPNAGAGMTLPPPLVGAPRMYSPSSFGPRQPAGSGPFNAMAAALAGPQYNPTVMSPMRMPGAGAMPPAGGGGFDPAQIAQLMARFKGGQSPRGMLA